MSLAIQSPGLWAAAVGMAMGLLFFLYGFRLFRQCHLLADTPRVPIGGMPMGLVEIHGKTAMGKLVCSPLSQRQCLFFRVDVTVKAMAGPYGYVLPRYHGVDFGGDQFYVRDETGKVLVDACGAELDMSPTAERRFTGGHGSALRRAFLGEGDPLLTTGSRPTDYALETYAVEVMANQPYRLGFLGWLKPRLTESDLTEENRKGRAFLLREYCVLPDHWYDVTGTCIENPRPSGPDDRNMIVKGENEPTFLISWRTEQGIEGHLRWRSLKYIFGGGLLSVVCLSIMLSKLGWL